MTRMLYRHRHQTNCAKGFPPEPSGYLHLGHAKAAILNQYFATSYKGKLIVRFDDTNPAKEKAEFQDSILEDLHLLGIVADQITYTSDYFAQIFELAQEMIRRGSAYADDTVQEEVCMALLISPYSTRCESKG